MEIEWPKSSAKMKQVVVIVLVVFSTTLSSPSILIFQLKDTKQMTWNETETKPHHHIHLIHSSTASKMKEKPKNHQKDPHDFFIKIQISLKEGDHVCRILDNDLLHSMLHFIPSIQGFIFLDNSRYIWAWIWRKWRMHTPVSSMFRYIFHL